MQTGRDGIVGWRTVGWMVLACATPAGAQPTLAQAMAAARLTDDGRCRPGSEGSDILVCGRGDRDRYRLPLPDERAPAAGARGPVGEPPRASAQTPSRGGCGIFAGQRRCAKKEARDYGYGGGRDPVTLLGRLGTRLIDPDADIAPLPAVP